MPDEKTYPCRHCGSKVHRKDLFWKEAILSGDLRNGVCRDCYMAIVRTVQHDEEQQRSVTVKAIDTSIDTLESLCDGDDDDFSELLYPIRDLLRHLRTRV